MISPPDDLPSPRGETWNDTEAINRQRELSPSQRIALATEAFRAALLIARPNSSATFAPERIVATLIADDVNFAIVGDLAGAAHGVVRATDSAELAVERSAENLGRLTAALTELGAEHPIDSGLKVHTRDGDVTVIDAPPYSELIATAISVQLSGAPAHVCSLADLRAMKLASGRPRHLIDLDELDELDGPLP